MPVFIYFFPLFSFYLCFMYGLNKRCKDLPITWPFKSLKFKSLVILFCINLKNKGTRDHHNFCPPIFLLCSWERLTISSSHTQMPSHSELHFLHALICTKQRMALTAIPGLIGRVMSFATVLFPTGSRLRTFRNTQSSLSEGFFSIDWLLRGKLR